MDDPLLLTYDLELAKRYLTTTLEPAYNCEVNVEECLVNFEIPAGMKMKELHECDIGIPWCGILINKVTLVVKWILLKASDFDSSASLLRTVRLQFSDGTIYLHSLDNNEDVTRLRGHLHEEYCQMTPGSRCIGDFNTQKSLMDALLKQLPDSAAIHVFGDVKAQDSKHLRDFLWGEYTQRCERLPDQQWIGYIMENMGYQSIPTSANYWYLGKGLHIESNTVQDNDAIYKCLRGGDLSEFATTIRDGLATVPLFLKMAIV
ncbi:Hypothetical predicted protein, partial [Paramuricea clavata]